MLRVCSLASGSNGNCYYLESSGHALVVDAGMSYKRLRERGKSRGIDLCSVEAIVVTHEHSDHVYGLTTLSRRADARVYMTEGTWRGLRPQYRPQPAVVTLFHAGDTLRRGPFTITTFSKPHDTLEPVSLRVEAEGAAVGIYTDIGAPCEALCESLCHCHLALLEANYDPAMLQSGNYTPQLKRRITNGLGHLSNQQSADVVRGLPREGLPLHSLLLAHISGENNTPTLARAAFEHPELGGRFGVEVLSREQASAVYEVDQDGAHILTDYKSPIKPRP